MASPPGLSILLVRPLAQVLSRMHVDGERFLRDLGVDADTSPSAVVPAADVDRLLDAIAVARRDPAFGLTMARAASVSPLGLFGHLVWLSETLRDALTRASRFFGLVSRRTVIALEERPGETLATLRQDVVAGAQRGAILAEFTFASMVLRARAATGGRFVVRAVRFTHTAASGAPHEALFQAPVTFAAARDELVFDASLLALGFATADPITAAAVERTAAELGGAPDGRSTLRDRVRRAAEVGLGAGALSLAAVAKRMATGERALRRSLEREGTSLRAVVDEVRRERADALLKDGLSVKEIAFLLGFSEASAFSRAYKRWTGRTPGTGR